MHLRVAESISETGPPAGDALARLCWQAADTPVSRVERDWRAAARLPACRQSRGRRSTPVSGQREAIGTG